MAISPRTAEFLSTLGHEVFHVLDFDMAQAVDEEIIEIAKARSMSVLTEDLDYGAILAASGDTTPGVVILRVGDWTRGQIEQRLQVVFEELPEEQFENTIVIVERHRVRIRRLPIR